MKLTNETLKKIIKEELQNLLEQDFDLTMSYADESGKRYPQGYKLTNAVPDDPGYALPLIQKKVDGSNLDLKLTKHENGFFVKTPNYGKEKDFKDALGEFRMLIKSMNDMGLKVKEV